MPVCEQPSEIRFAPREDGLSWRANFVWALAGNIIYAACQWGMIVALAKLGNSFMVGQFSLGLAIATPVLMFTNLQLRSVQATDAKRRRSFGDYLGLRVITTLIALAAIATITSLGTYERDTAIVILAVALMKAIESFSDIFYGLFQLNDHLDQVGKSMMIRGIFSVVGLGAVLYLLRNLVAAIFVLVAVWSLVLIFFDAHRGQYFANPPSTPGSGSRTGWRQVLPEFHIAGQWKLAGVALPLGIVMTLFSLNLNMPRYFIHVRFGEHQLGIFSAMAYTTVIVATFADALGHSTIPRMSRYYANGRLPEFCIALLKLVALGGLFGLTGLVVVRMMGARLLTILFSAEYAPHIEVFLWLVVAAVISCIACLVNYAITSAQYFRIQVPIFAVVVTVNALACIWLVPSRGLTGAALALVIAALVHLTLVASTLVYVLYSCPKKTLELEPSRVYGDNWEAGI